MAFQQKKYEQSDAVKQAADQLTAINTQKPGAYQSEYQPQLKDLAGQILNRKEFSYDLNGDELYNQYKDRYVGMGQQGMMDTMGMASKLTGGYGNSYAQLAGQQTYQGMLQGLNDKIPELYQLAMDRYNQQGSDLMTRFGLLNTQEQQGYDRWLNDNNMWLTERNWLADQYNNERNWDYGTYRDAVADDQWMASFNEDLRRYNQEWDAAHPKVVASSGGSGDYNPKPKKAPITNPTNDPMEARFQAMREAEMALANEKDPDRYNLAQSGDVRRYRNEYGYYNHLK